MFNFPFEKRFLKILSSSFDNGAPGDVVTEDNLKEVYSIDVKLIELDENRKVCVPMKTNLKLDL